MGGYFCQYLIFFFPYAFRSLIYCAACSSLWTYPQIPFSNFVRTNSGEMSKNQLKLYREKIRSIGVSILGGNSGLEGSYELGIDSIRSVNEDEVLAAAGKHPRLGTDSELI